MKRQSVSSDIDLRHFSLNSYEVIGKKCRLLLPCI